MCEVRTSQEQQINGGKSKKIKYCFLVAPISYKPFAKTENVFMRLKTLRILCLELFTNHKKD